MKTVWPLFLVNLVASSYVRYNQGIGSTSYNTPRQNQYSFYQFLQRLYSKYLNHQRGHGGGQSFVQSHGSYPAGANTYRTDETRGQAGQLRFNDDLTYPTKQTRYQVQQTLQAGQSVGWPSGLNLQVAQTRTQAYPPGKIGYQGAGQTHPPVLQEVNTGQFGVGDDTLYQSKLTAYQIPDSGKTLQTGWPSGSTQSLHVAQTGSPTYLHGQTGHQGYQAGIQTDQSTITTPRIGHTKSQANQKAQSGSQTHQTGGQLYGNTDLISQVVQTPHETHQPWPTDSQRFQAGEINQSTSVTPEVFQNGSETNSSGQAASQTSATGSSPEVDQYGNTRQSYQSERTGSPTQQTGATVELSQQQVIKESQKFLTMGQFVDQYGQTGGPASLSAGTVGQTDQMFNKRDQFYQTRQQTNVQPSLQDNGILTEKSLSKTVQVQIERSTNTKETSHGQTLNRTGQKALSEDWANQARASAYVPLRIQTRDQVWVQARNPYTGSTLDQTGSQQGSRLSARSRYQYGSTLLQSGQQNSAFGHIRGQYGDRLWRQPGSQQRDPLSQTRNSLRKCQGKFVCVARYLCENADIHTTLTCSNPQHVCCDD